MNSKSDLCVRETAFKELKALVACFKFELFDFWDEVDRCNWKVLSSSLQPILEVYHRT
jgi:hypothetical protein